MPGSPQDPRCQGSNGLIRQGATLVQSAAEVLEGLAASATRPLAEPDHGSILPAAPPALPGEDDLAQARSVVLESLSPSPVPVDELVRGCQLSPSIVQTVLLELELAGRIERRSGNQVNLLAS
ncbi:DNA processing protein [Azospirillaceae bacterium]